MPHDPLISLHSVGGDRYELSCLRTRSVRDQIVRTELLVERLIETGRIAPGNDLLVVGGGVAGVSAALAAITRGIDTTLVEKLRDPFDSQAKAATRRLHPSEFDWPQPHWRSATIDAPGDFALQYVPATAARLAMKWRRTLDAIFQGTIRLPGRLELIWGADARTLSYAPKAGGGVDVSPWPRAMARSGVRRFGACISCIGFSGESTSVDLAYGGQLVGPLFWSTDDLAQPDLGSTPNRQGVVRAIVSGGGDGAQQDFLRVLTGMFGIELADALGLPEDPLTIPCVARAMAAEDFALRAFAAASVPTSLPKALQAWQIGTERVVRAIWLDWRRSGLDAKLARHILKRNVQATWLLGGARMDYSYALNRVLASLVARLHAQDSRRLFRGRVGMYQSRQGGNASPEPVVLTHGRIDQALPIKRSGATVRSSGTGPWALLVQRTDSPGQPAVVIGPYEVVVPRHGVQQAPLFAWPPIHEQRVAFGRPR